MPVTIQPHNETQSFLEVTVTGKLHKEDYEAFVPRLENEINTGGKLRLLFDMRDFHGWDAGALWEDLKFDLKHFSDFERIAMVGDKKWEEGMAAFCKPFTTGKVEYFDQTEHGKAVSWLTEDLPAVPNPDLAASAKN